MAETRRFGMHPHLLFDVIRRQAGTLHKAILEAVMNAVDAGATKIAIRADLQTVAVGDDGQGMTDRKVIEKYWETFGQPPEAHEKKTYGQFRMGRGQLFAFGTNVWETGRFQMTVDIWRKGLDYELTEVKKAVPGCKIAIALYNQLTPSDLAQLERELDVSVKYVPAKITLNGKALSVPVDSIKWDHETTEAYVRLRAGNMYIYNLGVLVCSQPEHTYGCGGEIVSKEQLKVNFARNEVMADCPVWRKIKPLVVQKAENKIRKAPLTDGGRQRMLDRLLAGEHDTSLITAKLLQDVSGRYYSLQELASNGLFKTQLTVAPLGDRRGDRLMQHRLAFVMAEENLSRLRIEQPDALLPLLKDIHQYFDRLPTTYVPFNAASQAISEKHELVPEKDWTPIEQAVLKTLTAAQHQLQYHTPAGMTASEEHDDDTGPLSGQSFKHDRHDFRKLKLGISECADGWTDGELFIAINREYIKKTGTDVAAWGSYGCLLVHELCHDESDQESHVHAPAFYQLYHDWTAKALGHFVDSCLGWFPDSVKIAERQLTNRELKAQDKAVLAKRAATKLEATRMS